MTIDIQEELKKIGSHEDSNQTKIKFHENLDLLALDVIRDNERGQDIHIVPSSPFYNSTRNKLDHITLRRITIDSLPTIIAFNDTWQQNLQPFINGSDARDDHKKTISAMMEFLYDVDFRVTHQKNYEQKELDQLINSNVEYMFLLELGQKIIGNFSRLIIVTLQDRTTNNDTD